MRVPVWVGVTGVDEPVSVLLAYWEPFGLNQKSKSHFLCFLLPLHLSNSNFVQLLNKPLTLLIYVETPRLKMSRMITLHSL